MVKVDQKIIFDNDAKQQLRKAIEYIRKDSVQNAEKVKNAIINSIKELSKNPEMHPLDKYRLNNDGNFRAYEIYKYRITYHLSAKQIRIIRIRHTKMNPLTY
jgi:addiction module RelE/StbE family toxin